jgi:hypothetical protein
MPSDGTREVKMSTEIGAVRQVCQEFAIEFLEKPYLCYTEHGLHALLFARLLNALPHGEQFVEWDIHKVCVLQKEYPTAHDLGKSKRQHWDLAVVKSPPESLPPSDLRPYDCLRLASAIEVGLNEPKEHLREDIRRLYHQEANIDHGFVLHLYRLSRPGSKVSRRDRSSSSRKIFSDLEKIQGMLEQESKKETAADREVEILCAVAGHTGEKNRGLWLIGKGGAQQLA